MFLRLDFTKSSALVKKWDGKVITNPNNEAAKNNATSVGQELKS